MRLKTRPSPFAPHRALAGRKKARRRRARRRSSLLPLLYPNPTWGSGRTRKEQEMVTDEMGRRKERKKRNTVMTGRRTIAMGPTATATVQR